MTLRFFFIESSFKHNLHRALLVFSASALLVEGPATDDCKIVPSGADPCSTSGGIIPHVYRFFGILKFWGGYSGFADFSSFNDFENLGYIQVLTKMYLNN